MLVADSAQTYQREDMGRLTKKRLEWLFAMKKVGEPIMDYDDEKFQPKFSRGNFRNALSYKAIHHLKQIRSLVTEKKERCSPCQRTFVNQWDHIIPTPKYVPQSVGKADIVMG